MRVEIEYEGPDFEPIPRRRAGRVMDQETQVQFGCSGKRKIPTLALAKVAARRGHARAHYFCPVCHYWHVGNRTRLG